MLLVYCIDPFAAVFADRVHANWLCSNPVADTLGHPQRVHIYTNSSGRLTLDAAAGRAPPPTHPVTAVLPVKPVTEMWRHCIITSKNGKRKPKTLNRKRKQTTSDIQCGCYWVFQPANRHTENKNWSDSQSRISWSITHRLVGDGGVVGVWCRVGAGGDWDVTVHMWTGISHWMWRHCIINGIGVSPPSRGGEGRG